MSFNNALSTPSRPPRRTLTPSFKRISRTCKTDKRSVARTSPLPAKYSMPSRRCNTTPLQRTPPRSSNTVGDRFIPSRRHLNLDLCRRSLASSMDNSKDADLQEATIHKDYRRLVASTLFDVPIEKLDENSQPKSIFSYATTTPNKHHPRVVANPHSVDFLYTLQSSPMRRTTTTPSVHFAKKHLYKRLDAPSVANDYYTDLISWSKDDKLVVALGRDAYIWDPATEDVTQLTPPVADHHGPLSSVEWCKVPGMEHIVLVGTQSGALYLFDVVVMRQLGVFRGRGGDGKRIAAIACNLSTGLVAYSGVNGAIAGVDLRTRAPTQLISAAHWGCVSGLAWNHRGTCLASGGNDDAVCLWDTAYQHPGGQPRATLSGHTAAVRALDWSSFRSNMLVSGGGTMDKTFKTWDTDHGTLLKSTQTHSAVVSVQLSRNYRGVLYTAAGYNDFGVYAWDCPSGTRLEHLQRHQDRVLSMKLSPSESFMASIAADETLSVWHFPSSSIHRNAHSLDPLPSFNTPTIR